MTAEFYGEYLTADPRRQQVLYVMNPNKIRTCENLMRFHEARDDKIIIFADSVFALKHYAKLLDRPFIYGGTPTAERIRIFSQFQYNSSVKTIFVSKVGDNSIDLPEATVIIQISAHYGSRRQEAQRLGRILRPKSRSQAVKSKYDAFFYSLVSQDTREMYYSSKRQQFLVEQGYGYRVLRSLYDGPDVQTMNSKQEQLDLLAKVLAENIESLIRADADDDLEEEQRAQVLTQIAEERAREAERAPTNAQPIAAQPQYTRSTGGATV
jgi:DNA excision repair protein ERCC-3